MDPESVSGSIYQIDSSFSFPSPESRVPSPEFRTSDISSDVDSVHESYERLLGIGTYINLLRSMIDSVEEEEDSDEEVPRKDVRKAKKRLREDIVKAAGGALVGDE